MPLRIFALCSLLVGFLTSCISQVPTQVVLVVTATPDTSVTASASPQPSPSPADATVTTGTSVSPTTAPTPTFAPTATPDIFPTPTVGEVQVAEQLFQRGRMFWVQPTQQIWVLILTGEGRGSWTVYPDTYQDGVDAEVDAAIVAPDGLIQPTRGFGKLWRDNQDVRDDLGWATTPEFGYVSRYEYHPGGTIRNGAYVAAPGYHILYSLYQEQFRFNEVDSTWQLGGAQ
jgi:hypothetical protein